MIKALHIVDELSVAVRSYILKNKKEMQNVYLKVKIFVFIKPKKQFQICNETHFSTLNRRLLRARDKHYEHTFFSSIEIPIHLYYLTILCTNYYFIINICLRMDLLGGFKLTW